MQRTTMAGLVAVVAFGIACGASDDAAVADSASGGPARERTPSAPREDGGASGEDGAPPAPNDASVIRPLIAAAGDTHTCARLPSGDVKCWGDNLFGQLGYGDRVDRGDNAGEMGAKLPFVDLGAGRTAAMIAAGEGFSCALLDDGAVKCWGTSLLGEVGQGDVNHRGDEVGEMGTALSGIALGKKAKAIAVKKSHACAILEDDTLKCWGSNLYGQLGLGDDIDRGNEPNQMGAKLPAIALGAGRTVRAIGLGGNHTCAILDDAALKCWGRNNNGQLGLGDIDDRGATAAKLPAALPAIDLGPGRTAKAIAAGDLHTCVLLDDATVKCWGANPSGQLGRGDLEDRGDGAGEMGASLPTVDLGRKVKAISAGGFHTCAILDDDTLKCWGYNAEGRLGLGDTKSRGDGAGEMGAALPTVNLGPGRTVKAVSAGSFHTCATLDDGALKCWGPNSGRLGLGDVAARGDGPNEMGAALPSVELL